MTKPVIILINPQMGENIGAAARAMKNFGLSELRIVAPRDGWPNPKAEEMAAGAGELIRAAHIYPTTADAIADMQRVYATTNRDRQVNKEVVTPKELFRHTGESRNDNGIKTAILFGPERTGLTNEDVALADAILTVPVNPAYASLNIAQAVVVIAYEWFQSRHGEQHINTDTESPVTFQPPRNDVTSPTATKSDLQGLFDHLEDALNNGQFWKVPEKKPAMWRNIRATIHRAGFTAQDVRTLHGMIRALTGTRSQGK